jgi:hypothetical protein
MKNKNLKAIAPICIALVATAALGAETPKGWFAAGTHPKDYKMSADHGVVHSGKASAHIECIVPQPAGFGTLMQTFKADTFRGQRVRMSGYVRSNGVGDWAGLWMRVDGPNSELLAFDNMHDRPIKATNDWTKYDIVLSVPENAKAIAFGLLLTGPGQVWIDDLSFHVVGKDVPTTGSKPGESLPSAPTNLDFEE